MEYHHHGIEVGDGEVIHLTGDNKKNSRVIKTPLPVFLQNRKKEIVDYDRFIDKLISHKKVLRALYGDDPIIPTLDDDAIYEIKQRIRNPEKAVTEAEKCLSKPGYDIFKNNCEHFAVFCKTGLRASFQVIELIEFMRLDSLIARNRLNPGPPWGR